MISQPLWLRDLLAYSIQAAALVGVGVVMAWVLRLRLPRVRHAYWQALLAVCVSLPLLQPWRPEVLDKSGAALSNIIFAAPAALAAPAGPSLAEIVLVLICAGIFLRLVWLALGLGRLWLYRRHAQQMEQAPEAVEEAQRLAPANPVFFISRQIPTPATFGFFRPAILFPACFLEMEPAMQKAVALHELLHVERRDWLWNMFEELVLTGLWFHLPLWWVVRSARLSREQVVDAEAVRRSKARRPYLKALLEMAGQRRLAESLPAPLFLRESQLAERVALMMKEAHMSRTRLTVSILTAATTLLFAGATLTWAFPLRTSAPQTEVSGPASRQSGVSQENKKTNTVPQKRKVETESPSQTKQRKSRSAIVTGPSVEIGQAEIQRQVDEAMKQAKIAEEAASKIDQKKLQKQIEQAMRQAKIAQEKLAKIDQAEINRHVEQALKQAQVAQEAASKIDQAKIQEQINQAMQQLKEMNTPEMRLHMQEQMKQLQKLNSPEIREQLRHAMDQAKIAQESAAKINKAEIQREVEHARKEVDAARLRAEAEKARKDAEAARKEVEKLREQQKQERMKLKKQRKEASPQPPVPPKPAPSAMPNPAPSAPPKPPTPPSSGIAGGAQGGVSRGVTSSPPTPAPAPTPPANTAPPVPPIPQN